MSSLSKEFQSMKLAMKLQHHRISETHKIRTVNTIKWKHLMKETLQQLALAPKYDTNLIEDLKTIINRIPDDKFIQAIINLQPYKPNFNPHHISESIGQNKKSFKSQKFELSPRNDGLDQVTTSSGSILKRSELEQLSAAKKLKSKQQLMAMFIEEDVLSKEISSSQHPYAKIIQGYSYLLQNKYRIIIEKQIHENKLMALDDFTQKIAQDFKLLQNFFKMVSDPIVDIFQLIEEKHKQTFTQEIHTFIINYLRNHDKICSSLRKIIRYYIKHSNQLSKFEEHCPIQAEIQAFDIPTNFQIQGCFIYTTTEMIAFSEHLQGKNCLSSLSAIRDAIYKDIDEYYIANHQGTISMEVSSAIQLQIIKFCLVKLKIFAGQILSGLTLLSTLYGQDEMAYHFDSASYIHSQLTIAFQVIQHNL